MGVTFTPTFEKRQLNGTICCLRRLAMGALGVQEHVQVQNGQTHTPPVRIHLWPGESACSYQPVEHFMYQQGNQAG